MARKKFDKKNAQTFSVVHRSHEDALYFDNDASKHVLVPAAQRQPSKSATLSQLKARKAGKQLYSTQEIEETLGKDAVQSIRENEGLAAQYGIFYDDSNYDYMQHLKPIGGAGDGVFIEATKAEKPKKAIEELIKDVLPSEQSRKVTFDDEENIPSELRKFNPDMDPRLREVLEALEDEAYVEEAADDGEIEDKDFLDLLQSGEVEDEEEFYDEYDGSGDEWDLDEYEDEYADRDSEDEYVEEFENPYNEGEAPVESDAIPSGVSNAWEKDFMKFKKATKNVVNDWDSDNEFEDEEEGDVVGELPQINNSTTGKKKSKNKLRKKMGAMTDTSSFSMSSSALFRTEGLTLLDDKFEQLNRKFEEEDPYMKEQEEFDMSKERPDLENMLDDFLDNYELGSGGRKLQKKDEKRDAIKKAADSVSKTKLAARRKKEGESGASALDKLGGSFGKMRI